MKAVVCDGVAFLDDRNFTATGEDTVLRIDSPRDVAAVVAAAQNRSHPACRSFWTSKGGALRAETRMLNAAAKAKSVEVESESFGMSSGPYGALKRLARHGVQCRLIVSSRELGGRGSKAIAQLEKSGVQVRAAEFNEKFAVAGAQAFLAPRARAITRAPIALRFDFTPTSFTFSQRWPPVTSFLNSEGGSFIFTTSASTSPSLSNPLLNGRLSR